VYAGNGDGTFQSASNFATGGSPTSIAAGQLSGGGKADIVTAGPSGIVVLRNTTRP
jgi:filamentous hemagglutinin family protein